MDKLDLEIIAFEDSTALRRWLAKNHSLSPGIWMRIYKKDSGKKSVNYDQALDAALCYGWIDAVRKKYDVLSFIQRFTPRRVKSGWSKRNCAHVVRLIKARQMRAPGLKAVQAAKADGRWEAASEFPRGMPLPEDFLKELAKHPRAKEFFGTLRPRNRDVIAFELASAKRPETRERRMKKLLRMLASKKKPL